MTKKKKQYCYGCKYLTNKRIDTGDWFEDGYVNRLSCRRRGNKYIGHTETTYIPEKPDWCPLKEKKIRKKQKPKLTKFQAMV